MSQFIPCIPAETLAAFKFTLGALSALSWYAAIVAILYFAPHAFIMIRGKNSALTSKSTILDQMNESRPLPMGQKEFMAWSDRILSGAQVPSDHPDSLRKVLSAMLMNLGQTESHKPDAYFIHALRKAAVNEIAHSNFQRIKGEQEERLRATQAATEVQAGSAPA